MTRVGVDTGGTFTDVVARDADGTLRVHKRLSTPDDPSEAIAAGVFKLAPAGSAAVVHGTTVATNALLERKGSRVVFVTTAGFQDLLRLRRQNRPELYALRVEVPSALVANNDTIGVAERLAYDGSILEELCEDEVARVVDRVVELKPDAVAICLLHSYANDVHEMQLAAALRRRTAAHVSVSSEIVREFREYERASTTVVNAFVGPVMSRYIGAIGERLPDATVEILQSSGGRTSMQEAASFPVHTVLSGPAGGVVGALAAARETGLEKIISFDMGGTSTDVSLCDGEPTITYESTIGDCPIRVPVLDILTVGAGGGSIARVDAGGALKVGPRSAGASPGPAAYGQGGEAPTVTDAHVLLGRLRPDQFLGGEMSLDSGAARKAVSALAERAGLSPTETAHGILDVADASMVRAIKVISSQRGRDPRDYTLVSFGGAGGLHACRLADALGMTSVLVPRHPGLLSAYGMLHADRQRLYSQSVLEPLREENLERCRAALEARAGAEFDDRAELRFSVDLRYAGQSYELNTALGSHSVEQIRAEFEADHERLYGYRFEGRDVELVAVRLAAVVPAQPQQEPEFGVGDGAHTTGIVEFVDGRVECPIYARPALVSGLQGPFVVTEYSGTTVVPRGWGVEICRGHLLLERK